MPEVVCAAPEPFTVQLYDEYPAPALKVAAGSPTQISWLAMVGEGKSVPPILLLRSAPLLTVAWSVAPNLPADHDWLSPPAPKYVGKSYGEPVKSYDKMILPSIETLRRCVPGT